MYRRDFFDDNPQVKSVNDFYSRNSGLQSIGSFDEPPLLAGGLTGSGRQFATNYPCIISKKENIPISMFRKGGGKKKKKRKKNSSNSYLFHGQTDPFERVWTLFQTISHYLRFSTGVNYWNLVTTLLRPLSRFN